MISLRGKRALVTGGSRGIGAATALLLAEWGADVGIGYRTRGHDAEEVLREMAKCGVRVFAHGVDLASPEGAAALFERATREFGGVDLFIANAGIWPVEDVAVADLPDARWHHTLRENLDAVFYTTRLAAGALGGGGRIVIVSSTAGQRGEAFHADYAASKGALISFVKSLAVELAPRDITVNCVAPGWVETDMVAPVLGDGGLEKIVRTIPLGRMGSPRDIAGPIAFLCSEFARHITGEVLNVNGGSVLCG
jgi:3-oxoacyl-[acyl-carrier protein] reductase